MVSWFDQCKFLKRANLKGLLFFLWAFSKMGEVGSDISDPFGNLWEDKFSKFHIFLFQTPVDILFCYPKVFVLIQHFLISLREALVDGLVKGSGAGTLINFTAKLALY